MNWLFRQFAIEHLTYTSTLSADAMTLEMRRFCERNFFDLSENLSGTIDNINGFRFDNKVKGAATLKGHIVSTAGGCLLPIKISPFPGLFLLPLLFCVAGLVLIYNGFTDGDALAAFANSLIFIVLFPGLITWGAYSAKASVLNNFLVTFSLHKLQ